MKISQLTDRTVAINSSDSDSSYFVLNYTDTSATSPTPATYKVSLTNTGKALSAKLNLLNYDATNRELKAYSISSSAYTNSTIGYYLNNDQISKLAAISAQANKSDITYDGTNKKITKTVDGTTTDVVTAATLKTDMSLNNVENKSSATILSELTSTNVTTALGYTPLASFTETDPTVPSWAKAATPPYYTKPIDGIPATDLAAGVIPDVSGFYTKPVDGIPSTDIASGVIPDVSGFYTKPADGIPGTDLEDTYLTSSDIAGLASTTAPTFTTSITIGSTTLTEAQLQALIAMIPAEEEPQVEE